MSEASVHLLETLGSVQAPGADADIMFLGSNPRETLAHYRLLFPTLVAYRGGLFVEPAFDRSLVDGLLDQSEFDGGVVDIATAEEATNGVGLLYEGEKPDEPVFHAEIARANAEAIGWVWRRWILETYGREVEVVTAIEGPDCCYVTFRSVSTEAPR
ncbi:MULTISPECIES: hypothetical protein [Brevundimonas]|uniref:hypothetical protein n=1 Tax=Brevundimonas TaxID=41275 RepID=UPI000F02E962|nr:hypothetical protein [Brevundimonas lutea]